MPVSRPDRAPAPGQRLRWAAALLLCMAAPAAADWKRDYELGLRAVEQGDWAAAERHMRAALADDGEANARKRFQGVKFDRYLPHWYAGLAAFRQGDCNRAADYWDDASSARVIAGLSDVAAEQRRLRSECTTRTAARDAASPAATAATAASAPGPAAAPQEPAARAAVAASPDTAAAPPSSRAPAPAGRTAREDRVAAAPPRTEPAPARVRPAPERGSTASRAPASAAPASAPAAVAQRAGPAPAELRRALDGWLGGRYDDVLRIDPAAVADARARAQLLLLRGAARMVLAELAGDPDPAALEAVRTEVRAARRSVASLEPDEDVFPPRYRTLVAATR